MTRKMFGVLWRFSADEDGTSKTNEVYKFLVGFMLLLALYQLVAPMLEVLKGLFSQLSAAI